MALGAKRLLHRRLVQVVLNERKVVAEREFRVALFTHIVQVDSGNLNRHELRVRACDVGSEAFQGVHDSVVGKVAAGSERPAHGFKGLHHVQLGFGNVELCHMVVHFNVFGVVSKLHERVCETVADGTALVVDWDLGLLGVFLNNLRAERRDIVSSVAFADDVEGKFLVFRVLCEKALQKFPHVFCHASFVENRWGTVAKARANGLVNPQHGGVCVPGIRVELEAEVLLDQVWAVFAKQGQLGTATRAARHPKKKRVVGWIVSAFKKPVEQVVPAIVNWNVAGIVKHLFGAWGCTSTGTCQDGRKSQRGQDNVECHGS
eukprot:m.58083 g.58083  ORF g.58083 m.58083 type:complete len:318 (+) comp12822_c0_seq1:436-1389(+)